MTAMRGLMRAAAAAPDALTSLAYAWTWLRPLDYRQDAVKTLMLVMLLEFLVVHSGAFIGTIVLSDAESKKYKTLAILGFGAFYMLFAGAFSLAFQAWWPAWTFLWLLASRFAMVWLLPLPRSDEAARQMRLWALSVAAYLGAVFVGVLLPLPKLGITPEIVPTLGLSGSGLWVEFPHTVMASGMLYFAAVAWSKWSWQQKS
ncbi:MAG: hypothetical protein ABI588_01695 [Arenimonas sp.]